MRNKKVIHFIWFALMGLVITGCQSTDHPGDQSFNIQPEPRPSDEPPSRYGNQSTYRVNGKTYSVMASSEGYSEIGIASWYGKKFHGRPTSTMEPFDMFSISAAHPSLPIPTYVRVTNLENQASIVVRVNDRGPFHDNRIIDLSYGAATRLGFVKQGTAQVKVEALPPYQVRWTQEKPSYAASPGTTYSAAYSPHSKNQRFVYLQAGAYLDSQSAQKAMTRLKSWLTRKNLSEQVHLIYNEGYQKLHIGPIRDFNFAENLKVQLSTSPWGKPIWIEVNPNR